MVSQPFYNDKRTISLVCNNQLFNCTDNQEIIRLYERYGTDCLTYLRGAFAFCLYDKSKELLFVARDRIGEKMLYYSEFPGGVIFSTELKDILKDKGIIAEPQLNMSSLLAPLRYGTGISLRDTYIEQIKRVQPGEFILVTKNSIKRKFYWKRRRTYDFKGTYKDAKRETLRLMEEAVSLEMQSDAPIAVSLSGGIDSSAVAALAKRCGHEIHSITTGYSGNHNEDERSVARRFAKEQGFIHHEIELSEQDYIDSFDELAAYLDEPITDSSAVARWEMFKKVKELGFNVLVNGDGGDELFYGYPHWNKLGDSLKLRREHESLFPWKGMEKKLHWFCFMAHHLKWVLYAGYPHKLEDKSIGHLTWGHYYRFIEDAKLKFWDETFSLSDYPIYHSFAPCPLGKEIDVIYDDFIDTVMTQSYMYQSYRLTKGNSLSVRSPFMDYLFVEHIMSLPLEYKYVTGDPKHFLKDVLSGIVPDYILFAPKQGFVSPHEFINKLVNSYSYKCFDSSYKYYNSILVDKVLSLLGN